MIFSVNGSAPIKVHIFPGVPHGFQRWPELETGEAYNKHLAASVGWALQSTANAQYTTVPKWQEHFDS